MNDNNTNGNEMFGQAMLKKLIAGSPRYGVSVAYGPDGRPLGQIPTESRSDSAIRDSSTGQNLQIIAGQAGRALNLAF